MESVRGCGVSGGAQLDPDLNPELLVISGDGCGPSRGRMHVVVRRMYGMHVYAHPFPCWWAEPCAATIVSRSSVAERHGTVGTCHTVTSGYKWLCLLHFSVDLRRNMIPYVSAYPLECAITLMNCGLSK